MTWQLWTAIVIVGLFALDAAIFFLGWHYTEHHRKPRWRRRMQRPPADPIDFSREYRVRDKTRRGPEDLAGPEDRERLPMSGRRG